MYERVHRRISVSCYRTLVYFTLFPLSTSAPPLTVDNVLTAVQGVHWRTLGEVLLAKYVVIVPGGAESKLSKIQGQHQSDADRLHAVGTTWVQGRGVDKEPSWRRLIWTLDRIKMTSYADNIRHFAEPVIGKSCDSVSVSTFLYSVSRNDTHASMPHINMCTTAHIQTIIRIYSHLIYSHFISSRCVCY